MSATADRLVRAEALDGFIRRVLGHVGLPEADTAVVARAMVDADLSGADTHGIFRLGQYVDALRSGLITPAARVVAEQKAPALWQVDGGGGLGHLAMSRAVEVAQAGAVSQGIAWVGVHHSGHAGAIGVYAERLAASGLIAMVGAASGINQVAPWGGREPLLGTNPIAFAVPVADDPPIVVDFATSTASNGTIMAHAREGRPVPEGWMVDRETDAPVTDPSRLATSLLLPMGGHKGGGLALVIGLLGAVANGADFGRAINARWEAGAPVNVGQFVMALDAGLLHPAGRFAEAVAAEAQMLAASAPASGHDAVRLPGMRRATCRNQRAQHGIPLSASLAADLDRLATDLGVPGLPAAP